MKKRKYFLILIIALVALFALCCASIILCVLNGSNVPDEKRVEHTMSFVFLFLHLIVLAILFFYSLRAYLTRSALIQIITTKDDGTKNKKTVIYSSIFGAFFLLIAVYFTTVLCGVESFGSVFSLGLQFALANSGYTIATLCLFLLVYKPDPDKVVSEQ